MKKLLILAMVVCLLLCFAPLAFCLVYVVSIDFDSGLYGIVIDGSTYKFVSINVSTGLLTTINSNITNTGSKPGFVTATCIDPATHTYYFLRGGTVGQDSEIVSINTGTGAVTVSPALHF